MKHVPGQQALFRVCESHGSGALATHRQLELAPEVRAYAPAVSETFGQVASVRILSYIENGNEAAAASVATILLLVALMAIVVLQVLSSVVARRG